MTEQQLRALVVETAKSYLGCKVSDGSHRKIIDLYNSQKPLPAGYKVKYTDAWCATFVSAVAVQLGLTDIILPECSCGRMITLYQKAGRWTENDAYIPNPGDILMYDWQDSGKGDNTGTPDHVGIVTSVSGKTVTVIEGNKNGGVEYRDMKINGRYIRGYCLPDYASKEEKQMNAVIPLSKIAKIAIVMGQGRTLAQVKQAVGCDYIMNGGLYDMSKNKPVCYLKADGSVKAKESWGDWGYAWDTGSDIGMYSIPSDQAGMGKQNYITCFCLGNPWDGMDYKLTYTAALAGKRGRTAIGLGENSLILFCAKDGSTAACTPEELRTQLRSMGAKTAIMLDGGASSQCDFSGDVITATRKTVNNYIAVWLKKEETPVSKYQVYGTGSCGVLNIRKGAGTGYAVVGTYAEGAIVDVTETKNGWAHTDRGWCSMQYLRKVEETATATKPEAQTESAESDDLEWAKSLDRTTLGLLRKLYDAIRAGK